MYGAWGCDFWARMGEELQIIVQAEDDIMVSKGIVQYKLHADDPWTALSTQLNESPDFSFYYKWVIPTDFAPTDEAQIRVLLYDDANNETIRTSEMFSIYSNRIEASIEPTLLTYKVGQDLTYNIENDSDNTISNLEVSLLFAGGKTINSEYNVNGIVIANPYTWTIPDNNYYYSQNCELCG